MNKNKILISLFILATLTVFTHSFAANDIFEAIQDGNQEEVKKFIKDVNKTDKYGITPLYQACQMGNLDIVNLLLKNGASVNEIDRDGNTALNFACKNNNKKLAEILIQNGASTNKIYKEGNTPLDYACTVGNSDIVKLLLDNGANVNLTSLVNACTKGVLDVVKLLMQHGAKKMINYIDKYGLDALRPLHHACKNNRLEIVKFLLDNGAYIDKKAVEISADKPEIKECFEEFHSKQLIICCEKNDLECVKTLLKSGIKESVNKCKKIYETPEIYSLSPLDTPIRIATTKKSFDIVKILLDNDATIDLGVFILACSNGSLDILKLFMQHGTKENIEKTKKLINETDEDGLTPLSHACKNNRPEIVKFLLDNGANVDLKSAEISADKPDIRKYFTEPISKQLIICCEKSDLEGVKLLAKIGIKESVNQGKAVHPTATTTSYDMSMTPIKIAISKKSPEIIKILLDNGANIDINVLSRACSIGSLDIVKLLMEHGADKLINKTEANQDLATSLHWACMSGNSELVKYLLDNGAKTSINIAANKSGAETPLYYACHKGSLDTVKVLLDYGANIDKYSIGMAANKPEIKQYLEEFIEKSKNQEN